GIGSQLGTIFDGDAQLFHLRERLPVHIGGTDVEMAGVEDPELLMHDGAAAVPGAHIDGADGYASGELMAQPFGLAFPFAFATAWALKDADGYATRGGVPQSLVELLPASGAHPHEIPFVEALVIVACGIG